MRASDTPEGMNETALRAWLDSYKEAWEARDPEAAAALFSEDVEYYESPFGPPAKGRAGVRDYWANATRGQADVAFSYEVLAVSEARGMARWQATFTRLSSGASVHLDGVFLLEFNHEGLCRELREWWHRTER